MGHVEKDDNRIRVARIIELCNCRQARDAIGTDMSYATQLERRREVAMDATYLGQKQP